MQVVIKMRVGVNELRQVHEAWAASGVGSFDAFVMQLLLAAAAQEALKRATK